MHAKMLYIYTGNTVVLKELTIFNLALALSNKVHIP